MSFDLGDLTDIQVIQNAFYRICTQKMQDNGYFDMSFYMKKQATKGYFYKQLEAEGSTYVALYSDKTKLPTKSENARQVWQENMRLLDNEKHRELSDFESIAIAYWVYYPLDKEGRQELTKTLVSGLEKSDRFGSIKESRGVVYDEKRIELHFLSSLMDVNRFIFGLEQDGTGFFFRGHSNPNFGLQPSVLRTKSGKEKEYVMYHELLSECPDDFRDCKTSFQKLVKMQHYGLPTRLLDITRNPLVALFFACEQRTDSYGELVLIAARQDQIRYPQDKKVVEMASLLEGETDLIGYSKGLYEDYGFWEYPSVIVLAEKTNPRIVKQDGAFIMCGIGHEESSLDDFRYQKNGKKVIAIIDKKKKILEELNLFRINRAMLFPEIESVSSVIKAKYM